MQVVCSPVRVVAAIQSSCSTSPTQNISGALRNFVSMSVSVWLISLDAVAETGCSSLSLAVCPAITSHINVKVCYFDETVSGYGFKRRIVLDSLQTLLAAVSPSDWESEETSVFRNICCLCDVAGPRHVLCSPKSHLCPAAHGQPNNRLHLTLSRRDLKFNRLSATCRTSALFHALS
jgi:hypothetical protein